MYPFGIEVEAVIDHGETLSNVITSDPPKIPEPQLPASEIEQLWIGQSSISVFEKKDSQERGLII